MHQTLIEIEGRIREDGTLELDQKVNLPPGRVKVTVRPTTPPSPAGEDLLTVLQRIWAEQDARGYVPRTREEIDAQVKEFRDEVEEHFLAIEKLQEKAAEARRQQNKPPEPST
jgi:hypothetical protein